MPKVISSLPVGSRVVDPSSAFNGKPIVWKLIAKNHPGYPDSSATLLSDRILSLKSLDAREPNNPNPLVSTSGSNRYSESSLRHWLNGVDSQWYQSQNDYDEPPISAYVENGKNSYAVQPGFVSNLSARMRSALKVTPLTVARNTVTEGGGSDELHDKVFLLSKTEVGLVDENGVAEGTPFDGFSSSAHRAARPTAEAIINSEFYTESLSSLAPWPYWLRSPVSDTPHLMNAAGMSGIGVVSFASHMGVRPAINIGSDAYVQDEPNEQGEYVLIFTAESALKISLTGEFPAFTCSAKAGYIPRRFTVKMNGATLQDESNPKFPKSFEVDMNKLTEGRNVMQVVTVDDKLLTNTLTVYLNKKYQAFPETQLHKTLGKTVNTNGVKFTLKRESNDNTASIHRILGGIG